MSKHRPHSRTPSPIRPQRTLCNLAALAALGLLTLGEPVRAAPAGTLLPANTIPVLRPGRTPSGITVNAPTAYTAPNGQVGQSLRIDQAAAKAIVEWQQFNIGRGSKVEFVQPSATAAVLNRIFDADPSIIQGQLKANGQVYLINQNGILFDRGSQIDVNTLIASTLNLSDDTFNNPQGLTAGGLSNPALFGGYDANGKTLPSIKTERIVIGGDAGGVLASATAPAIHAAKGGAVMLFAPLIDNQTGVITAPDGQVILAAGRRAYLQFSDTPDFQMRGMLVEVTADGDKDLNLSSLITNSGTISADRGNVTLAALAINQRGRISATSAMQANGSIYLQARNNPTVSADFTDVQRGEALRQGTVTLSAGSVTETPLDLSDTSTMRAADDYTAFRSRVWIDGAQIVHQGTITSHAGDIRLSAFDSQNLDAARLYLDSGSVIDASGVWSDASNRSNLLTFKVTSNELKDSPDQKAGVLRGAIVTVDLRAGSSVLDLSGYRDNQAQSLLQKAAAAGVVTLKVGNADSARPISHGSLIQRANSVVNVAGGGVRYLGSTESTTKLVGADGRLYDISTAPEALTYRGLANQSTRDYVRWGYSETFTNRLLSGTTLRPTYLHGADGGSVTLDVGEGSVGVVLDGRFIAGSTIGALQRNAAPSGGTFSLGVAVPGRTVPDYGTNNLTFTAADAVATLAGDFTSATPLSAADRNTLRLSASLMSGYQSAPEGSAVSLGFSDVNLNVNGSINLPAEVVIQGVSGASLNLRADQTHLDGHVHLPSGSVSAAAVPTARSAASPATAAQDHAITVGDQAQIDVRGTWSNAYKDPQVATAPTGDVRTGAVRNFVNGGSIDLSGAVINLQAGSLLDASAGGTVSARGVAVGGNGGSISIEANGLNPGYPALMLDGQYRAFGFGSGGSLALTTRTLEALDRDLASVIGGGGFQKIGVTTLGDLVLRSGTQLVPRLITEQLHSAQALDLPSGSDAALVARRVTLSDDLRKPVSLSLASTDGELRMEAGSRIDADPLAAISLSGVRGVDIDGSVKSAGGSITLRVAGVDQAAGTGGALPVLTLREHAVVSTAGAFVAKPNPQGLVQGTLIDGGNVALTASRAAIEVRPGSLIDLSGASHAVDLPALAGSGPAYQRVLLGTNAGTLSVTANDAVTLGGDLRALAGASTAGHAAGGSLAINFTRRGDAGDPVTARRIVVDANAVGGVASVAVPANDTDPASTDLVTGEKVVYKNLVLSGAAQGAAGFDKLRLRAEDEIAFVSDVSLGFSRGVTLDTKRMAVADGADAKVQGASVKVVNTFGERIDTKLLNPGQSAVERRLNESLTAPSRIQAAVAGSGTFTATADTLDLSGAVTLSGVSQTTLSAANDLRLSGRLSDGSAGVLVGSLVSSGDLTLQAAQVYPTTATQFTIRNATTSTVGGTLALNQNDRPVTVLPVSGGAAPGWVFSAGGELIVQAHRIEQNGTIKAPLGHIALQATDSLTLGDGSLTSVSADGLVIPFGQTQSGVTWTYAATGSDPLKQALTAPPSKRMDLGARVVDVKSGARIDVSGGGDLQAVEFVPGSGGRVDALLQPNTYAIVPKANLSSMPVDAMPIARVDLNGNPLPSVTGSQLLGFDRDSAVYNSVRIGTGAAVPAGDYVLLPGYYALTPGAYMVQLLTGSAYANLQAGQSTLLQNGLAVVPGFMSAAGTEVVANRPIGVVVRPNSDIAKLADYTVTNSAYFADLAQRNRSPLPRLPGDGGQLTLNATEQLQLDGQLLAATAAGARSASVDIAASRIALVDQVGRGDVGAGFLQIDAASLSRLNASLLIGGTRTESAAGVTLTPTASQLVVANNAATALSAPELILAATDGIEMRAGSQIASSAGSTVAQDLTVAGPGAAQGALVRVSSADAVAINRPTLVNAANAGTVQIDAGAVLTSSRALQIDATLNTVSNGRLDVAVGGALALASGRVSLGETADLAGVNAGGLVLDNSQLASLNALGSLSIKSYGGIDLYGNAQVGSDQLKRLTLDSASLVGHARAIDSNAAAASTVQAQSVSLVNSTGSATRVASTDASAKTLTLRATDITLGTGDKRISGFAAVQFAATRDIVAADTGSLRSDTALGLSATQVRSTAGANQTWQALNAAGVAQAVSLTTPGGAALTAAELAAANVRAADALGSRLAIMGSDISGNARIVMKSGRIAIEASGDAAGVGGIRLVDGALLDAGGASKDFQGTAATASGGNVQLTAAQGTVDLATGARIDVSAAAAGGQAGTLDVRAKSLAFDGALGGHAATAEQGGRAHIDVDNLGAQAGSFSALNQTLDAGGYTGAIDLRVRNGDLTVGSAERVRAHAITLSADAGALTVNGTLDASSALGGGTVALYGRDLTLAAGSRIDASGTSTDVDSAGHVATDAHGGQVTAVASGGTLNFAQGAVIDVRSGAKGDHGEVLLRTSRTATGVQATLAGQVLSQRRADSAAAAVVVEGNRVYDASATPAIGGAEFARYAADNLAWMNTLNRAALTNTLIGDNGLAQSQVHVRPAVEVQSSGDLSIVQNGDLTGTGWRIAAPGSSRLEAGSLNLRAAGDLKLVRAWLGNPDASMVSGDTWSIGLTSGADLQAADAARTQSASALQAQAHSGRAGAGDLVLDSVRTEATGLFNVESPASIRTGNGDIRLSAGRDFVITAAVDALTGRFDRVDPNGLDSAPLIGTVFTTGVAAVTDPFAGPAGENRFGQGGGDITVTAQRDAIGAGDEWMTEWYRSVRQSDRKAAGAMGIFGNGVWWAYRPDFHDGVASFGGGNLNVAAGRDINGLSAWTVSSARGLDAANGPALQTFGGGDLQVVAGNDLIAGQYMVSQGQGVLKAGGSIHGKEILDTVQVSANNDLGWEVKVEPAKRTTSAYMVSSSGTGAGSTRLTIEAGQSIDLASIDHPSSLPIYAEQTRPGNYLTNPTIPSFSQSGSLIFAPMLNYASDSSLMLQSKAGDLKLGSTPDNWWTLAYSAYSIDPTLLIDRFPDSSLFFLPAAITLAEPKLSPSVLPPQVTMTAFGGSLLASGSEILFPSSTGSLKLHAAKDIVNPRFVVSDAAPAQFDLAGQVDLFASKARTATFEDLRDTAGTPNRLVANQSTDRFINDVVALDGSIQSPTLTFPTRSRIWAGQDISAPRLLLQNLDAKDETQVIADRGSFFGAPTLASWGIAGPGQLLLQAGQDIELSIAPLKSFGNAQNLNIADPSGAQLTLAAGFSGTLNLSGTDALFTAVVDAGNKQDQTAARQAIAGLMPAERVRRGDINSYSTSIQSDAGGGIDLLAPNGNITVGLTSPSGGTTIGVITNAGGSIRSVLSDQRLALLGATQRATDTGTKQSNFNINRGKVLAASGGDLVIYTTDGSIDAGKGAKTAVTAPAPQRRVNKVDGSVTYVLPTSVQGSGIQTAGNPAGSIFLFAPAGTIDAGEAGIKSGANISIAALSVLNADNISAAGSSAGVPVVQVGSVASTLASSGATTSAGVTKDADAAAQSAAAAAQAAQATAVRPAILTVEVLGFGDKNCREQDRDCFAK